jgi:hypothetical protein
VPSKKLRRRPPSPTQLRLRLEPDVNQPPKAPPSPALLEALAELLLTATGVTTPTMSTEDGDEREDRR